MNQLFRRTINQDFLNLHCRTISYMNLRFQHVLFCLTFFIPFSSWAQIQLDSSIAGQTGNNIIVTSVPFLNIAPDSRSGALGDAGVALPDADANATYWNAARLAFAEKKISASLSYTPWLHQLVKDMWLSYLTGYYQLNDKQTVAVSMYYFNLGEIDFRDESGNSLGVKNPREYALSAYFAQQLSKSFSLGVGLRFINSNLTQGVALPNTGVQTQPGRTVAADISAFWKKDKVIWFGRQFTPALGINLSNIGGTLKYTDDSDGEYIPANLRIGGSLGTEIDQYNRVTFLLDFNKLMVPTTGTDSEKSPLGGVVSSFTDAPGGFSEEMQEITISTGLEYWYADLFAARAGYFYESKNKGNRQFISLGAGIRYNAFGVDFAYLIPTARNHPLQDTVRFSLLFDFGKEEDKKPSGGSSGGGSSPVIN